MIYLDNAASTRPYDEVIDVLDEYQRSVYANPSALHSFGSKAAKALDYAGENLLKAFGIKDDRNIIYTSGATESANLAIKGVLERSEDISKYNIVTTQTEHACVSRVFDYYQRKGCESRCIPVDHSWRADEDALVNALDERTKLVSLIWVNNEVGAINDITGLAKKIKNVNKDILIHIDAVQGLGKIKADFSDIDMITVSGHKFHAPKGIGALICKKNIVLIPQILGGGQQNNLRSGTVNAPLIAAMGKACEMIAGGRSDEVAVLQKYLYEKLCSDYGEEAVNSKISTGNFAPHIISVSFEGIKSEVLLHMLENDGIYVSTSSACSAHKKQNTVLAAYGLSDRRIRATVRISLSEFNTRDEIDFFCDKLKQHVALLSGMRGNR